MVRRALKWTASSVNRLAAMDRRVSVAYLSIFRLIKYLPDGKWKNFILNSLQSVDWPVANLSAARVEVGAGTVVRIVPHVEEFDFAAHLYRRMQYEAEVTSWISTRNYDVVIEIGANIGLYTLLFSAIWPGARIYSFEPSRVAYGRLLRNLELSQAKNVFPFNCAVSSGAGLVDFHEPVGHLTNGSLDRSFAGHFASQVETTKVVTVSGYELKKLFARGRHGLIKIDVEGMEPTVIRALEPILTTERPDMLIEVLEPTAAELNQIDFLRMYRLLQLTPDGPVERHEFIATGHRDYALIVR